VALPPGLVCLLCFSLTIITNYRWRQYEDLFSIPSKHAAETAPLAAIIGWSSLCLSVIVARAIALQDLKALLCYITLLLQTTVWVVTATAIPRRITLPFLFLCALAVLLLSLDTFQQTTWTTVNNAVYIWLFLVLLGGFVTTIIALHWRTREELIQKISKADKKIKIAERFFFFGKGDRV